MGLTLPSDLFPQEVVGAVTGLSGLAAGLIGTGFTLLVGLIVDKFSYRPAFIAAGLMPILATVLLYLLIKPPPAGVSIG
jgi:ACS family hexuronate transporter-like MFS transporter